MESKGYASLENVQAAARAVGSDIDRRWIAKYVRIGLLPPQPVAPGLGRGLGRQAIYTHRTPRQVQALVAFLQKRGKNLDAVGWDLWFAGHQVAEKFWRPKLLEISELWQNTLSELGPILDRVPERDDDAILNGFAEAIRQRRAGQFLGTAKRHLRKDLLELLDVIFAIAVGDYISPSRSDQDGAERRRTSEMLSKGLGIPGDASDVPKGRLQIHAEALIDQFDQLTELAELSITATIADLIELEIHEGRHELAVILHCFTPIEQNARSQGGSFGATLLLGLASTPKEQAGLLVAWLMQRQQGEFRAWAQALVEQLSDIFSLDGAKNGRHTI